MTVPASEKPLALEYVEKRSWWRGGDSHTLWSDRERLQQRFPEMTPIDGPPSLRTWNLCGTTLYGTRDYDAETQTYVATVAFVILLIPIFFVSAYRVRSASGGGWYFLGRVSLSPKARTLNRVTIPVVVSAAITWFLTAIIIPCLEAPDPMTLTFVGVVTAVILVGAVGAVILWNRQKTGS